MFAMMLSKLSAADLLYVEKVKFYPIIFCCKENFFFQWKAWKSTYETAIYVCDLQTEKIMPVFWGNKITVADIHELTFVSFKYWFVNQVENVINICKTLKHRNPTYNMTCCQNDSCPLITKTQHSLPNHIDAFWRLCSKRRFENIVTKEEIALFCHNVFHFLS